MDDNQIELLERQLSERITEHVGKSLFKLYSAVGVAVIGALGLVSWDIVSEIKSEIKSEITDSIDKEVKDKRTEISERVSETRFMAKRANKVLLRLEKQLDEFQPQAESLDEIIKKVQALNVTAQNLTVGYSQEIQPLLLNVESLSSQIQKLAEQVNELNMITVANPAGVDLEPEFMQKQRSDIILDVIEDTKIAEQRFTKARNKTTVFFQYRGSQELAMILATKLKLKGYNVPGEDREAAATGKREVRYFHDEDKESAERLAGLATKELSALGLAQEHDMRNVVAKSFVSYSSKKPSPGVMELWLDIP